MFQGSSILKWVLNFIFVVLYTTPSFAEPWLATRFAQNCAACHAPGRKNLPSKRRRCNFSCQGCHVNPNGGGLRSFYGKWNENHWLRSFRLEQFDQPKVPAPIHKQIYSRSRKATEGQETKDLKKITDRGLPLVRSQKEFEDEILYDQFHDKAYHTNARSRREFEYNIPQSDPYRLMDSQKLDGGADFRFLAYKNLEGSDTTLHPFLMDMSYGIRYRPMRHYHFVYESRFFGQPIGQRIDLIPGSEKTRSLYLMADDLSYNSFVMYGYYKPLFGNQSADHSALSQKMVSTVTTGQGNITKALYRAFTVGSAPNVPYGNIHYIFKRVGENPAEKESGFAGNIGLRFVSFGLQANYSFWATKDESDIKNPQQVEMHAIEFRGAYQEYIVGLEAISFAKDDPARDFREGGVITLDGKYRFWRENYATLDYAQASTALDLGPGSGTQMRIGTQHYLVPGFNVAFAYTKEGGKNNFGPVKRTFISIMAHSYF